MFRTILSASFVAAVSAHQNFHQFWVNGVTPGYEVGVRMPPSNSPVTDVTSNDMACNVGGSTVPSGVETVAASEGDEITVLWDQSSHPGPITHFLFGPVDDAAQATGVGAGWFKIDELDYVDGVWANEVLMSNGGNYTFRLPTGLESGEYLLRSEMLALHGAQEVGGGQFYIGCAQLKITGTGGGCSPTISLPGAYSAEDDNIFIPDVYFGFDPTTYSAPGGAVATCGSGSGGGAPVVSTTAVASPTASASATATSGVAEPTTTTAVEEPSSAAPTATSATAEPTSAEPTVVQPTTTTAAAPSTLVTSTRASTSASAAPTSEPGVEAAALYGQCGGANWTGPTTCAEGTCTVQNAYYSQCVNA